MTAWAALCAATFATPALASDFSEPWKRSDRAIVIDAYENNPIDWGQLATDKRIAGFINKGSDGLPPDYHCKGNETERRLCRALWLRYSVAKELYHTRKTVAKALGMEWGVYHLGRPGDPIEQANHLIDYARPDENDLIAIDIEENDPEKWMSLEDAEEFARHIRRRLGRFPVLYTNGTTAMHIAANRDRYPLLSRLHLWYARYKPEIGLHFPKGNWDSYALWQFSAQANCNVKSCPYRVPGVHHDIDVNVAAMSEDALRHAWPFGGLVDGSERVMASVPVPIARADGLKAKVPLTYAAVTRDLVAELAEAYRAAGQRRHLPTPGIPVIGLAELMAARRDGHLAWVGTIPLGMR
ncbi:MAG: muramidase [Rhizobiaceae bacterium]|nr:muramidase [Rhizobiaceae bacterium]MCV0406205.1 muramidase [Rhizobiaceae bacterium]